MTHKMRIITTVKTGGNSELFGDLARMPREDRAERLRHLASIGLMVLQGQIVGLSPAVESGRPGPARNEGGAHHALPDALAEGFGGQGWECDSDAG